MDDAFILTYQEDHRLCPGVDTRVLMESDIAVHELSMLKMGTCNVQVAIVRGRGRAHERFAIGWNGSFQVLGVRVLGSNCGDTKASVRMHIPLQPVHKITRRTYIACLRYHCMPYILKSYLVRVESSWICVFLGVNARQTAQIDGCGRHYAGSHGSHT